ncbi:MAG: DUF1302 family protein [Thermodesulfobacteriota bacterium]|nr:DUF1302 family protein [Thermodesulfobacteriota bacterium]
MIFFIYLAPSQAIKSDPFKNLDFDFSDLANNDTKIDKKAGFYIGGYLESRNQLKVKEMDKPISLRQRLWLDCYLGQDWVRGFASGYFDYDPAVRDWTDDNDEIYYVELNEAYLTIDTECMDIILGKKMMRWGTGDGINPMDLINPKDYRDPIASARADARLPILLANGIFLLGPVTMEGVLIPKPEVNKFFLPNSPWEPKGLKEMRRMAKSGEIALAPKEEPDDWFKDTEFAFRISTVWKGFDLALLYYNGYTDDPAYHRDYLTDGGMRFTPRYHHYKAYGFNFAKGFERVTIRGELAVKPGLLFSIDSNDPSYKEDSDGLVARDLYQGVTEIDYTFFTNLYVNLQFFVDMIEDGKEALAAKRKTHGITFEISDKFLDDDVTAGFRGMYFTSNEGSACEIFAEYKIGDNWQIAPGFMLFNGPKDSRLGQFNDNDMVYFNLKYSF